MQNRILREYLALTGTSFTFFGLVVMILKRLLAELELVDLSPWGFYIGMACLAVAGLAFLIVIYLDETYFVETSQRP